MFSSCLRLKHLFPVFRRHSAAKVDLSSIATPPTLRPVGWWLLGCSGMCAGAICLGGLTRLTESGLSMVEWRLFKDMNYPKTPEEWIEQFQKYKAFPEYEFKSKYDQMSLDDFKFIYKMEWLHRMWGRATGLVFIVPAAYFWMNRYLTKGLKIRCGVFAGLLGFQGALGWYMVKSGLQKTHGIPRVSQYRLAAHLGTALILYAGMFYNGLSLLLRPYYLKEFETRHLRKFSHPLMLVIFLTALSGAFVAGLDAGLHYNSWPLMADRVIPSDIWNEKLGRKNLTCNPTTVQFIHRRMAELTTISVASFWYMSRGVPLHPRLKLALNCMLGMVFIQASLGITTLLKEVPTSWAASHQTGSVALLSTALWVANELKRLPKP